MDCRSVVRLLLQAQLRAAAAQGHSATAPAGAPRGRREAPAMLLEGPPGCGKTALAAALAEAAFPHPTSVCWLSMAQFSGPDGAAQLLGPPPGMVGHREGGVLTQQVRKRRRFLLVAEDLPLAHAGVLELLATMLRTGSVTAGSASFDCRHVTLVATRRTGANNASPGPQGAAEGAPGRTAGAAAQHAAYTQLVASLDKTIAMPPLDAGARTRIAANMLERVATGMRGWKGAHVAFAEGVLQRTAHGALGVSSGGAAHVNFERPSGFGLQTAAEPASRVEHVVSGHEVAAAAQEVEEAVLEHMMTQQRAAAAAESSLFVSLDDDGRLCVGDEPACGG